MIGGKLAPSPTRVTVQGSRTWPIAPERHGCPAGARAARLPALTRTGKTLFFLAAADQRWHDPAIGIDPAIAWQLMRSDVDGSPQAVGEPLAGAYALAASPDSTQVAIALDEKVVLQPVAGGPPRARHRCDRPGVRTRWPKHPRHDAVRWFPPLQGRMRRTVRR
ncbi:hypothetical protein Areg01_38170 [Actinoplanes regularis]|nr:hypothetical protein Areg01_38170 [Actinoplanes regularis]